MANYLKGIGDATQRINEILPSMDARIFSFLCGHSMGVVKDEFYEFAVTIIDRGVIVKSGMMQAHGYFGSSDTDTQINFLMPSMTQYCHLYAEIDLAVVPNRFEIKATSLNNNPAFSPRQDNLRSTTNGKFQLQLWQITVTPTSIVASDCRMFIAKPLWAVNAETAENALALDSAKVQRSEGVFSFSSGGDSLGKLVCIPTNAKIEYKIPLLTKEYWFQKGAVSINVPNWNANKTYEWNYRLNGDRPSGEVKRVRGGEFTLSMSASGKPITLFMYGAGTFSDGDAWDKKGNAVDFEEEDLIISQIYEIQEVG